MNTNDMGVILDEIKRHGDSRKFTPEMAESWATAVHASADEAMEAVRVHYAEATERIMPAHINRIAGRLRRERGMSEDHIPDPDPPVALADAAQVEARWIQRHKQLQASGSTGPQARAQTHYEFHTNDTGDVSRPDMESLTAEWARAGIVMPDALLDPDAENAGKARAASVWSKELSEWCARNRPGSLAATITERKQ